MSVALASSICMMFQWTVLARPKVLLVEQLVKFAKLLDKEKRFLGGLMHDVSQYFQSRDVIQLTMCGPFNL